MRPDYRGEPITQPWDEPWLIQRLVKPMAYPEGHFMKGKDNPFVFGGGFRNGGLSNEAMDLLRPIFGFDYMGAAEFEFGAVPKAFQSLIASAKDLATSSFDMKLEKDAYWYSFDDRYYVKPKKGDVRTVYVIAHKDHHDDVKKYIKKLASKDEPSLKEGASFRSGLFESKDPKESWLSKIQGWLDLDNCLMFFIDKDMFEKTWALFSEAPKEAVKS